MRVLSVPSRLRFATALLLLSVPIAAIQTVIVSRAPWWRLPYPKIAFFALVAVAICTPIAAGLTRGKRGAFFVASVAAMCWCILSAALAVRYRQPSLGFFTLFLAWFFGGLLYWIRHEISRSYFDPQLSWYQGLPKPIPGLICRLAAKGETLDFRVSRLDKEGAFLFREHGSDQTSALLKGAPSELLFSFRDQQVKCQAIPMSALKDGVGVGLQFSSLSSDARKELGDFVETLRGEGYVQ